MVEFPYMFMIATIGLMLGIVWTLLWSGAVFGNLVARLLTWFMLPPDEELRIGSIGFATLGGQVCVCARVANEGWIWGGRGRGGGVGVGALS
jgi:hypothetical protein